jgi:hypothetical protein
VRDGSGLAWGQRIQTAAHLAISSGHDQHVNAVDLALVKGDRLVLALELRGWVEDDALLSVGDVFLVLATEHALDGAAAIVLCRLIHDLGNVPVLVANLERAHGKLGGVVGCTDDVGRGAVGLGGEVNGLGVSHGVAVKLDTEHDLDHVAVFEDDLGIGRKWSEVGDDVVDGDGGGECKACCERESLEPDAPLETLTPFFDLFHSGATASATSLSPLA